jgi:hypothetical protein
MTSEQVWEPFSKDFIEREEESRTISLQLSTVTENTIAQGGGEPPAVSRIMD